MNQYILELKRVATDFFKSDEVKIVLFGSRARKDSHTSSDVDIGIIPYGRFDEKRITLFREKLEDSNIPYEVDVVNLSEVSEELREQALKEGCAVERLSLRQRDALRALKTLDDILKERFSIIVRDVTIERFEYTFEALWKFLREYLKEREGIVCNSPKSCFRGISSLGFLTEEETVKCLEMTDSRNDTSHTYKEMVGEIIYRKVKKEYLSLMKNLMHKLEPGAELNQPNEPDTP